MLLAAVCLVRGGPSDQLTETVLLREDLSARGSGLELGGLDGGLGLHLTISPLISHAHWFGHS